VSPPVRRKKKKKRFSISSRKKKKGRGGRKILEGGFFPGDNVKRKGEGRNTFISHRSGPGKGRRHDRDEWLL